MSFHECIINAYRVNSACVKTEGGTFENGEKQHAASVAWRRLLHQMWANGVFG